ncbi:hypothetical protein J8J40_30300, partial [Mycobacterium tuberculosis]|nr:hypothetical protein [Mycobacterium tuberculosis]
QDAIFTSLAAMPEPASTDAPTGRGGRLRRRTAPRDGAAAPVATRRPLRGRPGGRVDGSDRL